MKGTNWILILGGIIVLLLAYISWDKKKRKELEERLKAKTEKPVRKILVLVGIALLVFGILGTGKGLGIGIGDRFGFEDEGTKGVEREVNSGETNRSEAGIDMGQNQESILEDINSSNTERIYVRIRLRRFFLQDNIVDYSELEEFLKNGNFEGKEIVVQEDYADNECYESLLGALKNLNISYTVQHL